MAAATILARHTSSPPASCWKAVRHLILYLRTTPNAQLTLRPATQSTPKIVAFVDSDHAGDNADQKSMSGGVLTLAGSYIHSFARKQTITALCTVEADYVEMSNIGKVVLWLRNICM